VCINTFKRKGWLGAIWRKKYSYRLKLWGRVLGPIMLFLGFFISLWIIFSYPKIWEWTCYVFHYNYYLADVTTEKHLIFLGFLGFFNFVIVLFGMYFMTDTWEFGEGEFRKAITISILTVFFAIWALGDKIVINTSNIVLDGLFTNFWIIVTTVIGFYFASRAYENR